MYQHSYSLEDGTVIQFREEKKEDMESVWSMFSSLSDESRSTLPPYNHALIERWSNTLEEVTFKPILAYVESKERVVGKAMLTHDVSPARKHRAELGIVIHDDYQGKGVGTNLILFMIHLARSKGLKKLILNVFADNDVAIHVFENCGFEIEGLFTYHYWFRGRFFDVVRMGLSL